MPTFAQHGSEQIGLVLAVTETGGENGGGFAGLVALTGREPAIDRDIARALYIGSDGADLG